jgi:hypothetical protein
LTDDYEDSVKIAIAETKIDHLIEQIEALRYEMHDFNNRVRALERWRAWLGGALALLLAAIGASLNWFKK